MSEPQAPSEAVPSSGAFVHVVAKTTLSAGEAVITERGHAVVRHVGPLGVILIDFDGRERLVRYDELRRVSSPTGAPVGIEVGLAGWWSALKPIHREQVLFRLEVVQEILTGYRFGRPELAREGEPRQPFGPDSGASLAERCRVMAQWLTLERETDRGPARAGLRTRMVGASTIKRWVRSYQANLLRGLDDARRGRVVDGFPTVPAEFKSAAREIVATFDGDEPRVSNGEIKRRANTLLRERGITVVVPQQRSREFIAELLRERGGTTRAHRSHEQRKRSGTRAYSAIFPGQLVSIDATRADVLVYDPFTNATVSVEIITAIDVATRVVLAVRVVPKSADSVDVSLLLYDVMRPFSLRVEGEDAGDWRWAGVPAAVDLRPFAKAAEISVLHVGTTLQGDHHIPGVVPVGIRTDHGSVFSGVVFSDLLLRFGIDQVPSRVGRPLDNNAVERLHDTYRRCLQQLFGFKGRNTTERGRKAGVESKGSESLLTAEMLERHLRRWIAIDYNARPHTGLRIPGVTERDVAPLELFDVLQTRAGSITVPQDPALLYDFLPVVNLTVSKGSVEHRHLTYSSPELRALKYTAEDEERHTRKHPFYYDPRDRTRIWFKHPDTGEIIEVPWRKAHLVNAPFADSIAKEVQRRIRDRPTYVRDIEDQIVRELGSLTSQAEVAAMRAQLSAASIRFSSAERDHAEAATAQSTRAALRVLPPLTEPPATAEDVVDIWTDEWPDLTGDN